MNFFLVVALFVVIDVYGRHHGSWESAKDEVTDMLSKGWDFIQPYLPTIRAFVVNYRWAIVGGIAVFIFLMWQFVIPSFQPPQISLHGGENIVQDACGNDVTLWVLTQHENPDRLEITPAEMGTTFTFMKPGSETRCARTITLNPKKGN